MSTTEGGRLLMEDSGWELWGYKYESRIWHLCPTDTFNRHHFVYEVNPHCSLCNTTPPEALIGLKALQDWDR